MKNSLNSLKVLNQFPFNNKHFWNKYDELVDDKRWTDYFTTIQKQYFETKQDKDEWKSVVDYPGVDPATISVTMTSSDLCIKAPKMSDVLLPFDATRYDADKLEVTIKHGRLTATAPPKQHTDSTGRSVKVKIE